MSFTNISLEEYRKLLKNKKKMFDMTFPTPETINKYREDDENLSKLFDKNFNKYFNQKGHIN